MVKTKILAVDDDEYILETIESALNGECFEVQTMNTANGILTVLESFKPDIILLDYMMPDISGYDVLRFLKCSEYSEIPVIFMTAVNDHFIHKELYRHGCSYIITKPFTFEDLVAETRPILEISKLKKLAEKLKSCL